VVCTVYCPWILPEEAPSVPLSSAYGVESGCVAFIALKAYLSAKCERTRLIQYAVIQYVSVERFLELVTTVSPNVDSIHLSPVLRNVRISSRCVPSFSSKPKSLAYTLR